MYVKLFTLMVVFAAISYAQPLAAQSAETRSSKPVTSEKPASAEKPKVDLERFFIDAEKQARKAQENGGPNCVPKPKDQTPAKPVS